jgi:transcriptional regulator with XRE-family HTH domain
MLVWTRQIKAARSLIGWEQYQLAVKAGVGIATVRRLERMNGPIRAQFETIDKIRRALESGGVEFIGDPKPGVCIGLNRLDICCKTPPEHEDVAK